MSEGGKCKQPEVVAAPHIRSDEIGKGPLCNKKLGRTTSLSYKSKWRFYYSARRRLLKVIKC